MHCFFISVNYIVFLIKYTRYNDDNVIKIIQNICILAAYWLLLLNNFMSIHKSDNFKNKPKADDVHHNVQFYRPLCNLNLS